MQLRHQEGAADPGRQTHQHGIDLQQGFDDQRLGFGRWHDRFRLQGKRIQVGLFDLPTPPMVDQQPLGDGVQVGSGLANGSHVLILAEHAHEGILRQVSRTLIAAQLPTQPAIEPAVMIGVETVQHLLPKHAFSCHAASHERSRR